MADNPNLRRHDANFLSSQPHEVDYVVRQLDGYYPHKNTAEIRAAVQLAARQCQPSEHRDKVMAAARIILNR